MNKGMERIILASASPRRKEILHQVGIKFEVLASDKEEVITGSNPIEVVKNLASMKANDISSRVSEPAIIIGADTIVVHNNTIMGKPKDEKDAKRMLREIQNDTHQVYTGVSIILKRNSNNKNSDKQNEFSGDKEILFAAETNVTIHSMSEEQIDHYITSKEPLDKAGAYAIQGKFAVYVKKIDGDYYNVVGLPIAKVYQVLCREGVIKS